MNKEIKDGKGNILLRFSAILGILALLLTLTAVSCEKKKAGKGNPPSNDPPKIPPGIPPGIPPKQGSDSCAKEGFTVTLANESFKEAFTFSKFAKDADTGSFDADLTVKLSGLTQANGFVSNHVWIHPDENKFAMPFREAGKYIASVSGGTTLGKAAFVAGAKPVGGYDWIFCGFSKGPFPSNYVSAKRTPNNEASNVHESYNPANLDGNTAFLSEIPAGDNLDSDDASVCLDRPSFGDIIRPITPVGNDPVKKGKLRVGYLFKDDISGDHYDSSLPGQAGVNYTDATIIKWDEEYETSMDKTGAYYVRDSAAYLYVNDDPTPARRPTAGKAMLPKILTNHVHLNDTDLFYNEVKKAFEAGGEAMADLASVFNDDINMGAATNYTRQPAAKSADNHVTPFGGAGTTELWKDAVAAAGELGTSVNGGWQKLFTITPCAKDKMKNGIAVAYGHADKDAADKWKGAPELTFDGTADIFDTPADVARKLIIRRGTSALTTGSGRNNHALLFESVVSPEYNGNNNLGFFTIQHGDHTADMTDAKNAFSTKGVIHCRSALGIADEGTEDEKKGVKIVEKLVGATADKVTVGKFGNKLQGYKDGAISDDTKGPGLTCYLGLSALWPDAIDGAEELTGDTKPHKVQFEDADKKDDNKYDFSDKHLGLLMINMPEDVTVNNALLLPIFNQFTSDGADTEKAGEKFKMEATKEIAKSVLKNIKDDSTFGYLHGNVKVTFSKE